MSEWTLSIEDEISCYNYPIDIHRSTPSPKDFEAFEREFFEELCYGAGESYGIPYHSLIPKGGDNLLVTGRCMSTDRRIQGSTRVMPCCFITRVRRQRYVCMRGQDHVD